MLSLSKHEGALQVPFTLRQAQGERYWQTCLRKSGYQLKAGQFKVKPFVVSLSNHERLNRPPFDKLRANG